MNDAQPWSMRNVCPAVIAGALSFALVTLIVTGTAALRM